MIKDANPILTVQKTGGFAGLSFKFEQRMTELQDDQKARLDALITACGLRETAHVESKSKNARDVFGYSFVLCDGGITYSASFDDTTLTPAYRELFRYMQDLDCIQ
jgi:hypothetical protein